MTWRSRLSLGAIAAVFVLGSGYLTFGVAQVAWFRDDLEVQLTLPNSGGLQPHSPVLLSGIPVGSVADVDTVEHSVQVRLRIDATYRIPTTSAVRIENLSALGEPYLQFTVYDDTGPYLTDGAQIDARRVQLPLSIPEMATAATDLLRQFDPQVLADLVGTATTALSGSETMLPQLGRSADLLAATLLSRVPALRTMLIDLQAVGADMVWLGPSLVAGGPEWGRFGTKVRDVVDALEKLMRGNGFPDDYLSGTGLVPFLDQLHDRLDVLGPELRPLIPLLAPVISSATGAAATLDLSALLTQALESTGDGALRLQITVR